MPKRITLAEPVWRTSVGVHSGQAITLGLHPAAAGSGLHLRRSDLGREWPVNPETAFVGPGCTAVGDPDHHVLFLEHLLAALAAAGITDLLIEVNGPEIPLFEGGALALWAMICAAQTKELDAEITPLVLPQAVIQGDVDHFLGAIPNETPACFYFFASNHPLIGCQWASYRLGQDDFAAELAPARTFITADQAQAARQAGMLAGGSEDNALVIYPDRLSATPALPQAFARHKLLDLVGDLYLLGRPVLAHIVGSRTGHRHNQELVRMLSDR